MKKIILEKKIGAYLIHTIKDANIEYRFFAQTTFFPSDPDYDFYARNIMDDVGTLFKLVCRDHEAVSWCWVSLQAWEEVADQKAILMMAVSHLKTWKRKNSQLRSSKS
jgi:hypothetical protein